MRSRRRRPPNLEGLTANMSAPVAIPAASTAGPTPAGSAWAQSATPATGFEALLAALLPTTPQGLIGQAKAGLGLIKSAVDAAAKTKTDGSQDTPTDMGALQAQLAALMAGQPVQAPPANDATSGEGKAAAPALPFVAVKSELAAPTQTTVAPTFPTPTDAKAAPLAPQAPDVVKPQIDEQPLVQPTAEPKAAPPPVLAALVLPQAETLAPQTPAAATPALASAEAATASATPPAPGKPVAKTDKLEASTPTRVASGAPALTVQAETALAAQPAQSAADGRSDQPPPEQRDTASSDKGAPDQVAPATGGPASAAHMIQAEAAAVAARGSPETVAKLAAQIVKKLEGKSSRFDIALDPIGLGKVDVKVEINAQGQMSAALNFDTASAAAELRGRAGELRAALEQAGFDLGNTNLSFSFAGQGDSSQTFAQRDGQRSNARLMQALADDQPLAAPIGSPSLLGSRTSGVDVRI